MACSLLPHGRERGFDDIDRAEEVGFELLADESQCAWTCGELFDGADDS